MYVQVRICHHNENNKIGWYDFMWNYEAFILMSGSHIKYKYWEIYEALLMGEIHNEILQFTM